MESLQAEYLKARGRVDKSFQKLKEWKPSLDFTETESMSEVATQFVKDATDLQELVAKIQTKQYKIAQLEDMMVES